jgi:hypothetical protein
MSTNDIAGPGKGSDCSNRRCWDKSVALQAGRAVPSLTAERIGRQPVPPLTPTTWAAARQSYMRRG